MKGNITMAGKWIYWSDELRSEHNGMIGKKWAFDLLNGFRGIGGSNPLAPDRFLRLGRNGNSTPSTLAVELM
jgi:hypothetical protein